ncbi:MAG: aldose 1-epimerase [Candidatus Thermoplasmatota archaeon]|nr:aldose 1-epimerase [Candidatus Thermoplasmatota archaeon]MCL5665536.1 aldose 1-epimerase [Candidatus Thermoplasmatota archaeon]
MNGPDLEIEYGQMKCGLTYEGAYLTFLKFKDIDIIQKSLDGHQTHGGSAVLIPYANRIKGAEYSFGGRKYSLPEDNEGNSIHGLVRNEKWEARKISDNKIELLYVMHNEGYPSPARVSVIYSLSEFSFSVIATCQNIGLREAPLMIGFHPYFGFKEWNISCTSPLYLLERDESYWPNGELSRTNTDEVNSTNTFDDPFLCYGDVYIRSPELDLKMERFNMPFLHVYNGKYSRGTSVAIEPMTGAPDCYHNNIGLLTLSSGDTFTCGFRIEIHPKP